MGILSWIKQKPTANEPTSYTPSPFMEAALREASERPLDDETFRLVIASPQRHFILDVSIFQMDSAFTRFEKDGVQESRRNATPVLAQAVTDGKKQEEGLLAFAALAYFDRAYTRSANAGKTASTAWNTLILDMQVRDRQLVTTRAAMRLEYPVGPVDLSLDPLGRLDR